MSEGTWFDAVTTKPAKLVAKDGGAVTLFFPCEIGGQDVDASITLILKDGTLREKGFKAAADILGCSPSEFPWARVDGTDESTVGLEISVCEGAAKEKGGAFYNAFPRGGQSSVDANEMANKYNAKLRALFGGTAAKPTPKPPVAKPPPPKPPVAPKEPAPTSTMEAAWEAFTQKHDGQDEPAMYKAWDLALKSYGKAQNDMTPEDWHKFSNDNLAF